MHLYLVQHGQSLSKEEDPERGLSATGIADVRRMADFLQGKITVERVVHSGKKRALQTGGILAECLHVHDVREMLDLDPMADPGAWAAHLSAMSAGSLMIVGHLPHLPRLVSLLLVGDSNSEVVRFTNAGVVSLEKDDAGWSLRWIITPRVI